MHKICYNQKNTYDGIRGAGSAWPVGRPCGNGGAPPPGRFGIAGAALDVAGGGGPRFILPNEPCELHSLVNCFVFLFTA